MSLSRREFIAALPALAAVTSAAAEPKPLLIGSQMYGWGQYYEREKKEFDTAEVLSALRDAGYDYAEGSFGAPNFDAVAKFADQLRAKGLKPLSMYTGGSFHEDGKAQERAHKIVAGIAAFKAAGFTILNCNPDPIGRVKTDAELKTQADALRILGEGLRKNGIQFGIHHHTPEMAEGAKEFHHNFRKTEARDVGFCYDVHWVFRGGVQPADALRDYGNRIVSWHLRQSRGGIWCEDMDTGDIDYRAIGDYAKEHNIPRNYTVELAIEAGTKITRGAVENHRRSIEFVRRVMA